MRKGKINTIGIFAALSGFAASALGHGKKTFKGAVHLLVVGVFFGSAVLVSAQDSRYIGGAGITVFADTDFRGKTQTFQYDVSDLRSSGLDNKISSLRIGPGEQWEVCADRNYRGGCIVVSGQESNLGRNGWGDRISSLRRTGGGWNPGNPGGGGGGGNQVSPPSWARGTFYGTAPDGSQITLTIANNGSVTANIAGSVSYGSYLRNDRLRMGENAARVVRTGNGLQTVSTLNGETINYNRNGWNPGNPGGGGGGNVPSWAVGSFRGRNPQNGTMIVMTINRNGSVTVNMGGGMSYGTLNGSLLTIGSNTARIQRQGNGFRTVSTGDGQTIVYSRY